LSVYELSFGAVCGICAGVFIKKGLKAFAFLLGGVFVLLQVSPPRGSNLDTVRQLRRWCRADGAGLRASLMKPQYMSSKSYISVDWSKLASRYDSAFGTSSAAGGRKAPTVGGVWSAFVDFLTADFQRESAASLGNNPYAGLTSRQLRLTMAERASFLGGLVLGLRLG
jgi:uncharacterized membrane protein (Fun14 family)